MAIDGNFRIVIESPMGPAAVKLNLKANGGVLEGSSESSYGKSAFTGKVNGNEVSWESDVNGPIGKMHMTFKGIVNGDDFNGDVKADDFGTYPFKGKRILETSEQVIASH